jgi:hypothetical protein
MTDFTADIGINTNRNITTEALKA